MSGEFRLVRGALAWGGIAAAAGAVVVYPLRGAEASASVLLAAAIALGNAGAAAGLSALAGRVTSLGPALVAVPSFLVRMLGIVATLAALRARPFVDEPVFASSFGVAVTLVLVWEVARWKRIPWLALTLEEHR